jgi:hypothetical protein
MILIHINTDVKTFFWTICLYPAALSRISAYAGTNCVVRSAPRGRCVCSRQAGGSAVKYSLAFSAHSSIIGEETGTGYRSPMDNRRL